MRIRTAGRSAAWWSVALVAAALCPGTAAQPLPNGGLADLSLEELSNLEITSVSRHAERVSDAPASVFVITGEDIRRYGATTLPEALRLAPNLEVARVNASQYAISARGFNNTIGNKLLVLIDGRTVYTPFFSSVFWDAQDVMLEDVERIEVISGPGATLWGANAVNGVINVITRPARDTQGAIATASLGNLQSGASARFGGKIGEDGHFRIYAKQFGLENTRLANGARVRDGFDHGQVGFRADWGGTKQGFTLQGDAYHGASEQPGTGELGMSGMNLLARWNRRLEGGSDIRVQAYVDHADRDSRPFNYRDSIDIYDIELQHSIRLGDMHRVVWGGGYRYARDHVDKGILFAIIPADKSLRWANLFAQDEIALSRSVNLTLGAKFETNVYTGTEFLPSARLAWKPAPEQLLWGALSRAVRAPARIDREFFFPGNPPFFIRGGPDFQSEVVKVLELGYRAQPTRTLSYSVSVFRNFYDKLRSGQPPPAVVQNGMEGRAYGLEAWGTYQASRAWRLSAGLSELRQDITVKPGSLEPNGPRDLGNDPKYQVLLRSILNLTERHEFDVTVRRVGALPNPLVPAYTAVDVRLGWRASPRVEFSLVAQNLFDPGHVEVGAPATASEIGRSVFLNLLLRP